MERASLSGSGYFCTNYKQSMAICDTRFRRFCVAVLFMMLVAIPFFVTDYYIHLLNLVCISVIAAVALQVVTGYCGLISIGHSGIMGAGAFLTAFMINKFSAPFWLVILAVGLEGLVIGVIVALPVMRVKGIYSVMSTLSMHFIIIYAAAEYERIEGACAGFPLPSPQLGPFGEPTITQWYFFLLGVSVLITLFCFNLVRTRPGRAWRAIRDRDIAAAALGVNVPYYKVQAFMVSCMFTTVAGSLLAYTLRFTEVGEFNVWNGIMLLAMIVTGGLGSILGAILGAVFISLLPYIISAFTISYFQSSIFALQFATVGLVIILFLLFEPRGLVGIWTRIRIFFELWPYKYRRVISTSR